jgi:hypothetical protein
MYLPNPDLLPTGFEPAEFIDVPDTDPKDRRPVIDQARVNITRWAEEYISGLVRRHDGDREDVRSVIHDLHLQCTLSHDR